MSFESTFSELHDRIQRLERTRRRDRCALAGSLALCAAVVTLGAQSESPQDLRVRKLTAEQIFVLDHDGRVRIVLGEDPEDTQRRSRAAGLVLLDKTGAERGGFSTGDDMSVGLGLDAPTGVGSPMGDRIGLVVAPDGAARIDLINNETMLPVRLVSDSDGSGGLEFFDYDLARGECTITRLNHEGETQRTVGIGK